MANPVAALFSDAHLKNFQRGQILIYEGDPPNDIYYIEKGFVKVYNILSSGDERIIFVYSPGDVFPMTSFLSMSGAVRYFYESMTDVQLRSLRSDGLAHKVRGNVEIGEALVTYSNEMNHQFFQRIDSLSVNDARRKVIALLSFLLVKAGTNQQQADLQIPLTSQTVADMCGLTRETASLQLLRLRKEGVLTGYKCVAVNRLKLDKLKSHLGISG